MECQGTFVSERWSFILLRSQLAFVTLPPSHRILMGNGAGDTDLEWICGPGWPGHSTSENFHKTRKLLFCRKNGFLENEVFIVLKRQTAKTEMTARTTRRYHVFTKISVCHGVCQSNSCFSWKPSFSFFCTVNSFHQEIMVWLEIANAGCSYFKQKNHHSEQPLVSLN